MFQIILFSIFLYIIVNSAFIWLNSITTNPFEITQNTLNGNLIDNQLYIINGLTSSNDSKILTIITDKELGIVLNNLVYPHKVLLNDDQINNNNYAYKYIPINKGTSTIELYGKDLNNTSFYISTQNSMITFLEIRLLVNAFMFFIHFVVLIGGVIYLVIGRYKKIVGFLLIFILSSVLKGINLGELTFFSSLFNMTLSSYNIIDGITTAINNIFPIFIFALLFDIKIKKIYSLFLFILIIPLSFVSQDIFSQFHTYQSILGLIISMITFSMIFYGFMKEKKAALAINILRIVFFILAIDYIKQIRSDVPNSNLIFFFNYAYLGATIYFVGIFILVISFYIQYNKDLIKKEKEYERIMLLKGLGHDLKHPVLTAKLNNQYLLECDLDDDAKDSVDISLNALSRLEKMIENINFYFNIKEIKKNNEKHSLDLLLKNVETNYKKQKDLILNIEKFDTECYLRIDPINFYRIFENIIDNAYKYNQGEKIVSISTKIEDCFVIISIQDNGIGFDKEEIIKSFDIFYRGDVNRAVEGFGIGLSVVKNLVKKEGGEISLESEKNIGSIFKLKFPIY